MAMAAVALLATGPAFGQHTPAAGRPAYNQPAFNQSSQPVLQQAGHTAEVPQQLVLDDSAASADVYQRLNDLEASIQSLGIEPGAVETASGLSLPDADCYFCPPAEPKYPTARITGLFQADAIWFAQDVASKLTVGDIQDVVDFRRARLAGIGKVADNVSYIVEMDFAFPGRPNFMDVWLDVDQLSGLGHVRVGHWRQPFGMDGLTGVRVLPFLERALPFAFFPFRQTGMGAYNTAFDEQLTWAFSGYKFGADFFGGNFADRGYGLATRVTMLPCYDEQANRLVHVGGAYSHNRPANSRILFANTPEVGAAAGGPQGFDLAVPLFVNTGFLPAASTNLFGAELAAASGSFYAQSELVYAVVDREDAANNTFPGFYVFAAYLLTGEHRPYNRKTGVFGRVEPHEDFGKGGCGAWEVAARWSYIDLNDGDVNGRRLADTTIGLNWYLNPYTKFQLNYIHAMLNDATFGDSDTHIFAARAALDF